MTGFICICSFFASNFWMVVYVEKKYLGHHKYVTISFMYINRRYWNRWYSYKCIRKVILERWSRQHLDKTNFTYSISLTVTISLDFSRNFFLASFLFWRTIKMIEEVFRANLFLQKIHHLKRAIAINCIIAFIKMKLSFAKPKLYSLNSLSFSFLSIETTFLLLFRSLLTCSICTYNNDKTPSTVLPTTVTISFDFQQQWISQPHSTRRYPNETLNEPLRNIRFQLLKTTRNTTSGISLNQHCGEHGSGIRLKR